VGLGFRGGSLREDLDLNVSKDIILIVFVVLWVDLGFRLNPSKLLTQEESGNNNNRLEFIYLFIYFHFTIFICQGVGGGLFTKEGESQAMALTFMVHFVP
jgi:hypothetical protein